MRLIDSHAHLLSGQFDADRTELLQELASNMEAIIECASAPEDFAKIEALMREWIFIYGAVGVHPEEISAWNEDAACQVEKYLHIPKVLAVGEIGLDYHWQPQTAKKQQEALDAQLSIASAAGKPVILHNREATADLYSLLEAHRPLRGVVHCFADGPEIAERALDMGLYLGFGGIVTFKNAGIITESVKYVPLDRILLETDCPYLAPVPQRGKRNRPDYTIYTAQKIAQEKGLSTKQVIAAANANARKLFGLPEPEKDAENQ